MSTDFLAPLTAPTWYFEGQDELFEMLKKLGLDAEDCVTVIHLIARALKKRKP